LTPQQAIAYGKRGSATGRIGVSCYFRHMKQTLAAAGITVTNTNKRTIDQAIHRIVGVPYKTCSPTWKRLKEKLSEEQARATLVKHLKNIR